MARLVSSNSRTILDRPERSPSFLGLPGMVTSLSAIVDQHIVAVGAAGLLLLDAMRFSNTTCRELRRDFAFTTVLDRYESS